MSDLNISKKNIYEIFSKRGARFLIPDYQRNYSWGLEHCETLWDDLKNFALPDENLEDFDEDNDEYFLGTIVTFYSKEYKHSEVIDGQQRLITLLLLLRAFYEAFGDIQNSLKHKISECIWTIGKDDEPNKADCKIKSEVITDDNISEFEKIISFGEAPKDFKSLYAKNYRYLQKKIDEFKMKNFNVFLDLPKRILNNCIILPIETNEQSTALTIFTTLNDRGLPLSDSDIFKAQFYKFFNRSQAAKKSFVQRWTNLEKICNDNFHPRKGTGLDDLFMRYMYYLLAKSGTKSDTFKGLRDFYEEGNYQYLKDEKTLENLETLAKFWDDIAKRDEQRFTRKILKRLFVLECSPYSIWSYIVSLYFMSNRDSQNFLEENSFYDFLNKMTAMIMVNAISEQGTHNIRRPFFVEFQNILHGKPLEFKNYRQDRKFFYQQLLNFKFSSSKKITRMVLAWYTFNDEMQDLPPLGADLEIEHIYAKKRHELYPLSDEENLERLGNKSLLEKGINIRAADYRFADKKKYYLGKVGGVKHGTIIRELRFLAKSKDDFTERDIIERNEKIFSDFMEYLGKNNLLK